MKYKLTNNTLDLKSQKKIQESLFTDIGDFYLAATALNGEAETESEEVQELIGNGMDTSVTDRLYEDAETSDNNPLLPTVDETRKRVRPFRDGTDTDDVKDTFRQWINRVEGNVNDFLQPGDDVTRDVLNAAILDPAKAALRGWTTNKAQMRLNSRVLTDTVKGALPLSLNDKLREDVRILDDIYPITRLMVESNKAISFHYDYFDKLDNGTLTDVEDMTARRNILDHEEKMLDAMDRMFSVAPDSQEASIANEHMQNRVDLLTRYNGRGPGALYADTKARITGLRNGWPIDDLNALSCMNIARHRLYGRIFYDPETGLRRKSPQYKPGEREYLRKMDILLNKIESTRVSGPQQRMDMLNEMHTLLKEGYDKKIFAYGNDKTAYDLYTMERTVGRKLLPAEITNMSVVMENIVNPGNAGINAEGEIGEGANVVLGEERAIIGGRNEDEGVEVNENINDRNVIINNKGPADEPVQGKKDRDEVRYDVLNSSERFFYNELETQYDAASKAIGGTKRPGSTYSDMLRYTMGSRNITFTQALELNVAPDNVRKTIAKEYFKACTDNPITGNISLKTAEKSARFYGEKDAKALKSIMDEPLPSFDPGNRDEIYAFAEQRSKAGVLSHFLMDYSQNINSIISNNSVKRTEAEYVEAFGGREEYSRIMAQADFVCALQNLAETAVSKNSPVYVRALAMTYLEKIHAEVKGKKLGEIDTALGGYTRMLNTYLLGIIDETDAKLPMDGAPSYSSMADYLDGKISSPFTEDYLKKNIDNGVLSLRKNNLDIRVSSMWRKYSLGDINLSRVYNLDHISLRGGSQKGLSEEQFRNLTDSQKKDIHRTFEQTLGRLVNSTALQSDMAAKINKNPLDLLRVDDKRLSVIIDEKYPNLSPLEKNLAMEAEALRALADSNAKVTFTPLVYNDKGEITEDTPKELPKALPHTGTQSRNTFKNADEQFASDCDALKKVGRTLDSFVPGMFRAFDEDYLDQRLDRLRSDVGNPENADVNQVRSEYIDGLADSAENLEQALSNSGRAMAASFVHYQTERIKALGEAKGAPTSMPFDVLNKMVDDLKLGTGSNPTFDQIANILSDKSGMNKHPFMLISAAGAAAGLQRKMNEAKGKAPNAMAAVGIKDREDILGEISTLESHIKSMRTVSGELNRLTEIQTVFNNPDAVERFVNGNPGSRTILADLEGRKTAIVRGWPIEDAELIAGFYSKRHMLKAAMDGMNTGTEEHLKYARAYRAMDEICNYIDSHQITDAAGRKAVLEYIDGYGNALYNDTVACVGMADNGQLARLKADMRKAIANTPAAENFRTAAELSSLSEKAGNLHPAEEPVAEEPVIEDISNKRIDIDEELEKERELDRETARKNLLKEREERIKARQREADRQAIIQDGEYADALGGLFDQDGRFYAFDTMTDEERARQTELSRQNRRTQLHVTGFFDNDETRERVKKINSDVTPGMLKPDALSRLMDDMRTYYLGKGECSYTLRENEIGEDGRPVWGEDGKILTKDVKYTVPVTNFEEALDLNLLPLEARHQIVNTYLSDLEAHPFGPGINDATAEENARYFADIHKKAIQRTIDTYYPGIDMKSPDDIRRLANSNSPLGARSIFSQNFSQNTELFTIHHPDTEADMPNRLRQAYTDEFGGSEEVNRYKDRLDIYQGMKLLANVSVSDRYYSLRQRALAKHYLGKYDSVLRSVNEHGADAYKKGSGMEAISASGYLSDPSNEAPAEGAPGDDKLKDYLEGKTDSPFSEDYIKGIDKRISTDYAQKSVTATNMLKSVQDNNAYKLENIYNLSYLRIPREIKNANGQTVTERQQIPDIYGLTQEQMHETDVMFDRTLGCLTGNSSFGLQSFYAMMKDERTIDRFRINGEKPADYLKKNGYPEFDKDMPLKEAETAQKAALLCAVADPELKVTFVPYVLNNVGVPTESDPVSIKPPKELMRPPVEDRTLVRSEFPDDEAGKYYMALNQFDCSFQALLAFEPDMDVIGMQTDPTVKEILADYKNIEKEKDHVTSYVVDECYYNDELDDPVNQPIEIEGVIKHTPALSPQSYKYTDNYIRGMQKDGSLNNTGKKNLAAIKSFMHNMKDKAEALADYEEKNNPLVAEYIRLYTDELRTAEEGATFYDLNRNFTYELSMNQKSSFGAIAQPHLVPGGAEFTRKMLMACENYPAGDPSFRLPQAIIAARRQAHMADDHNTAVKEGILTVQHDRASRQMLLSEFDALEKELRHNNELLIKSRVPGSTEEQYAQMLEDGKEHRKYLDNGIEHSTSHYPRGTKFVWNDMEGKRAMLANGWPMEDLNLLGRLYAVRGCIKENLSKNKEWNATVFNDMSRAAKTLDQIIDNLESTPIRNAKDRKSMLEMIDSYGSNLYNAVITGPNSGNIEDLKDEVGRAISRTPAQLEFLSEEELDKAKEQYRRYEERKNGPEPDAPTVNGPRSDLERAFLNVQRIGTLYKEYGRLSKDNALINDPIHAQTMTKINDFLTHVNEFYSNDEYLKTGNLAARENSFKALVQESIELSSQIDKSVMRVNSVERNPDPASENGHRLRSLESMQSQVRHMRSLYVAQMDHELRRKNDLARMQQEEERLRQKMERIASLAEVQHVVIDDDGALYSASKTVIPTLTDVQKGYLNEMYPKGIPNALKVQNVDGKLIPEDVINRETAVREAERAHNREVIGGQRKARREAPSQDADSAADLFKLEERRMAENGANRQLADKRNNLTRRQMQALDEKDARYTWSFEHILRDAYDKKTASEQIYESAMNAITDNSIEKVTELGIKSYEDDTRYNLMISNATSYLDTTVLCDALMKKWPEFYEQRVTPAIAELNDPVKIRATIVNTMKKRLAPAELHGFMDEQIGALREDEKDELRRKLLTVRTPSELKYEDQVVHPLHDRIEELKKADEYQNNKDYAEALEYADKFITISDERARNAYLAHRNVQERAYNASQRKDFDDVLASAVSEEQRSLINDLMENGEDFVSEGVLPGQEEDRDYILNADMEFNNKYIGDISEMLSMMEGMNFPVSNDMPGGTGDDRAFSVLTEAEERLTQAIHEGDVQKIIETKAEYEKARNGIDSLFEYASNENRFPAKSIPGNIDATRQGNISLEYGKDYYTNSKVNGVNNLYSILKWANIPIGQFKDDPNKAIRDVHKKILETVDISKQTQHKSMGEILGEFAGEGELDRSKKFQEISVMEDAANRCVETLMAMDPDREQARKNLLTAEVQRQFHVNVANHHVRRSNPYMDADRRDEVEQLLSIVDEESLAENRAAMLMEQPLDENGYRIDKITAGDYVASMGVNFDGYEKLVSRAEDILVDAMRAGKDSFDPVRFMENRQKALADMLTKRAADRNKAGFGLLEDEVLHTAEYYESVRKAHPEAGLPALNKNQIKAFNERSRQFVSRMKAASNRLTTEQKHAIAARKPERETDKTNALHRVEAVRGNVRTAEERFVKRYNDLETMRKAAANDRKNVILDDKRKAISEHRKWLIEQAAAGNIPTAYAEKRIAEISVLRNGSTVSMPAYDVISSADPKNHAGRVQADIERRELNHTLTYSEATLKRKLNLDKHEDPVERNEREQKEQADSIKREAERIRQQNTRINEEAEQARLRSIAREQNYNINRQLPLVQRMERMLDQYVEIRGIRDNAYNNRIANPEEYFNANMAYENMSDQLENLVRMLRDSMPSQDFSVILTDSLGTDNAAPIIAKIGKGLPNVNSLSKLSKEERTKVLTAMAGSIPEESRREIIASDDGFKKAQDYDFTSSITFDTKGQERIRFEEQVTHPKEARVEELLNAAGGNWSAMTGRTGTFEELQEFRSILKDADALITEVKPEIQSKANILLGNYRRLSNSNGAKAHENGLKKPENSFMTDLFTTENGIRVTREDRQNDVIMANKVNPKFDPDYIKNVANLLRKMEEYNMIPEGAAAEERDKVYSFKKVVDARNKLRNVLDADMYVAENRKKLSDAVEGLKTAQSEMDELMRMAKDTFSNREFMDNLDNVRNNNVPWQYARDMVTSSNLNGAWMFGALLKDCKVTIDEFEKDPDAALAKVKESVMKKAGTLAGVTENQSMGEIAAYGACNYYQGQLFANQNVALGKYTRGIDSLIEGEPAEGFERKEHNMFLFQQNIRVNETGYISASQDNSTCLADGFKGRTKEGEEALKTLTIIPKADFDPDRMLNKVPVNPDGTRKEPFRLGNYIKENADFDYKAQVGRLDQMLKDAARALEKIQSENDNVETRNYAPFPMVKARQKALTQLLAMHPENANKPGYAALEDEILHAAEKYDALRKSDPSLGLKELTEDQKKMLADQKKMYLELKNNRKKLMDKAEEKIVKSVRQEEKSFNTEIKSTKDALTKLNERIGRRDERIAAANDKLHLARLSNNERAGLKAYEDRQKLLMEKSGFEKEKQRLEQKLESLRVGRMRRLYNQYMRGELPGRYVSDRMWQIDQGRESENIPPIFANANSSAILKEEREEFLCDRIFNERGFNIATSGTDRLIKGNKWVHDFMREDEFEIVENPAVDSRPQEKAPVSKIDINRLKSEMKKDVKEEPGRRNSVGSKAPKEHSRGVNNNGDKEVHGRYSLP